MSKTVTIIDTFGFFFRSFYALPQHLKNRDGFPTGLLTGFTNFISTLQKQHDSDYLVFAIDTKGPTFRNEIDPNYKANRSAPPPELTMQLPVAIEWIDKMGYKTLGMEGYEADDIIATVTHLAREKGYNVRVVSHDKDLYQLIDDGKVVIIDAIKRKTMDEDACFKKYGVTPKQFIDYQSILGDSADNVPGVKGIGKVGAEKLLKEYGTLDNIYANIENIKGASQKKLIASKEQAYMSKELVTLKHDVFTEFDFEEYKMDIENPFLIAYSDEQAFTEEAMNEIREERMLGIEENLEFPPCRVEIVIGAKGRLYVVLPTGVTANLPFACNAPFVQDPARLKIKDLESTPPLKVETLKTILEADIWEMEMFVRKLGDYRINCLKDINHKLTVLEKRILPPLCETIYRFIHSPKIFYNFPNDEDIAFYELEINENWKNEQNEQKK